MLTTYRPLTEMTAGDVMSRHLVTIPETMTLRAAAKVLSMADISGAPVVDNDGRCTGVLSATDFLRWAGAGTRAAVTFDPDVACVTDWSVVNVDVLPLDEVRAYMTSNLVTVTQDVAIHRLAQMMIDAHIHRIVVLDDDEVPIGIVTSTDVLAAVANAPREV